MHSLTESLLTTETWTRNSLCTRFDRRRAVDGHDPGVAVQLFAMLVVAILLLPATATAQGASPTGSERAKQAPLQVGAAVIDVTPLQFPVLVNGGMVARSVDTVHTKVNARAVVIDSGGQRIALVVVDSCMIPRPLCDEAKQLAASRTSIAPNRIMISATHTHTAPASMGCLGTDADPTYVPYLREKLAEAIATAEKNLQPAEIGWGSIPAAELTALRRWVRRPDRVATDPFGNATVRANMHAANNWDDVTGVSGPEDPELSLISFRSTSGRPLAVLANFSMHYFGDKALSADYFGLFANGMAEELSFDDKGGPAFVGILSHGCSGDVWRRDYALPPDQRPSPTIDQYAQQLLDLALSAYGKIQYTGQADVAMAERRMTLNYRVPDQQRLLWAQGIMEQLGDQPPKTREEVYAREQIILHERQKTEIVLQAIRIGDIAIATTPNETYALTGLKLKLRSPLSKTMVIELANGGDGYIPPPEQHVLGGYNTWPARSAGLEVTAEPKIVAASLELLEQVAGAPRRAVAPPAGPTAKAVLAEGPLAFWQLDDMEGPIAVDSSGNGRDGHLEDGYAFFLPGATPLHDEHPWPGNRSLFFAGGRIQHRFGHLTGPYTITMWCWNGMPLDARDTTGWLASRDFDHGTSDSGDHLGVGGGEQAGRVIFRHGNDVTAVGNTQLERWKWYHVALVRTEDQALVYVNGQLEMTAPIRGLPRAPQLFIGGRSDHADNWEGRLDEVAVFAKALSPAAIRKIAKAAK